MMVLHPDINCIIEKPTASISGNESHKEYDKPKAINPPPKVKAVIAIVLPKPTIVLRIANEIALARAPSPEAAVRKPNVCGPPCSTVPANTGIRTEYGKPNRLAPTSRSKSDRIGVNPETYAQPSLRSDQMFLSGRIVCTVSNRISRRETITAR